MDNDQCEGCEKKGAVDWCGHWLCEVCHQIEREHADPELARISKEEREELERIEEIAAWPVSYRGDSMGQMRDWLYRVVKAFERPSSDWKE